ncbi:Nicotinate dehydrogenase FAD-subunit [Botrimarina hoheduenensis]|uniref:Nicotinate dehydrogenase FAD-subunit n=2 Tax=Botrimarina hoheduenensis TaxID=2528000 RepID=A0A5C5W9E5_9BACT|nr:Nicotinate dehydrogenase FAD-subunit [Botrimarina hoheduenensis]
MRDHLVFYLNGQRHTAGASEATLTLSEYLRDGHGSAGRLCGTKIACAEGDCGACTVLVGKPVPGEDRLVYETLDACIAFVFQMDRRHVVTVEGVGGKPETTPATRLTPPQQAMVICHGSQCGYCTPGFVMALHGLAEAASQDVPPKGYSEDELRLGLSGNLCRCTGYEQILEAGRSLAAQTVGPLDQRYDAAAICADFAQLGETSVRLGGSNAPPNGAPNGSIKVLTKGPAHDAAATSGGIFLPATLDELLTHRAAYPSARLVSGATDLGVQRNHRKITIHDVILTTRVPELDRLEVQDGVLHVGAAVSWSRLEAFTRELLPAYHAILTRFGSPQVRNAGSLVGNLANASPIADSIPFHYVACSTLELASVRGVRSVPIADFYQGYKQLDLAPDEVITNLATPLPTQDVALRLYKISKRRDMDISTVTMAFWIERKKDRIDSVRLAAGGVGPTVVRLPRAEAALRDGEFTLEAMRAAGRLAREEITPLTDVRGAAAYRLQLVENLFAKCWHELAGTAAVRA